MENELKLSEERQQLFNFVLSELEQEGNLAHEKNAIQHGLTTVYEHSVGVAGASLKLAEFFHLKVNEKALIRGALLHDYFLYEQEIQVSLYEPFIPSGNIITHIYSYNNILSHNIYTTIFIQYVRPSG